MFIIIIIIIITITVLELKQLFSNKSVNAIFLYSLHATSISAVNLQIRMEQRNFTVRICLWPNLRSSQ